MSEREKIWKAFENRLAIYAEKQSRADCAGPDDRNRWDALQYVIEAIEILALECGFKDELDSAALQEGE